MNAKDNEERKAEQDANIAAQLRILADKIEGGSLQFLACSWTTDLFTTKMTADREVPIGFTSTAFLT